MADDLDELYLGDFEGFVARRNELAKRLRADGDADAAESVRALTKPSRVAWAVNQFSDRHAKLRSELLDAGATLREAQEKLVAGKGDGASLKQARQQERSVVAKAIAAIEKLASKDGADLSAAAVERARQTLHAVALDENVRRDFERHRLQADRDASGLTEIPASTGAGSRSKASKKPSKAQDDARRKREALKEAESEARRLEGDQLRAEERVDVARRDAEKAQKKLRKATEDLEQAASAHAAASKRVDELR